MGIFKVDFFSDNAKRRRWSRDEILREMAGLLTTVQLLQAEHSKLLNHFGIEPGFTKKREK